MHGGAIGTQHLLLAETLGLAMARRASDILERHRATLTNGPAASCTAEDDDDQFAVDNAIFTAVLDAANECLGRFDSRPADDRWCDALLQVIHLAQLARLSTEGLPPRHPASRCVHRGQQLLAQPGRAVVRRAHQPETAQGSAPQRHGTGGRHPPVDQRVEQGPQAVRVDRARGEAALISW
jgi:hypothetical protein